MTLFAGVALADIQATPNAPPDSSKCSLTGPSAQCGQWTYWAALGALVIGGVVFVAFVIRYFRDAPRFQVEADGAAGPGRRAAPAAQAPSRPLAPPPAPTAPVAEPAPGAGGQAAVAVAEAPPVAAEATTAPVAEPAQAAPAAAPASAPPAAQAVERRAPSPRHEAVEPDQETFDRVLAEQLAKGTDRRVAEGRAKAAALKAAREKAEG
jgi:hypothetical protein